MKQTRTVEVQRWREDDDALAAVDEVALEEPLELRVDGFPVAVLMRTPGHDEDLTRGFLLSERIVDDWNAVRHIEVRPAENRSLVFLEDGFGIDPGRLTRHVFASSSCGLCGKSTLEAVLMEIPGLDRAAMPEPAAMLGAPDLLRASQAAFSASGGLHGAGLFSHSGELVVVREDVGRHNAVDKVIGHAHAAGLDPGAMFLLVSGRVSFEIMQKALAARLPLVAGISAPSSLAVEFARRSGQHLIGFLRPPRFNRYS